MKTIEKPRKERFTQASSWVALFTVLLLGLANVAGAAEHWFSGQVLQPTAEDAADETITDAALTGPFYPFVRVRLFNSDTQTLLGEVNANEFGQFTVRYDYPLGSAPNLEARVVYLLQDPATSLTEALVLPPAREDINSFSAADQFLLGVRLKILAENSLSYGSMTENAGLTGSPGLGVLFTRVGKVETQFIAQDTTAFGGLADFSSGPGVPASLGLEDFRQAPFGGMLFVFGDIGPPQAPCGAGDKVGYYRVMVRKPGETTWRTFRQPLPKTKTQVNTTPPLTLVNQRGPVGPFSGNAGAVEGLYWVNRNDLTSSSTNYTVYSFPDLRVLWNTNQRLDPSDSATEPANGLYEIRFEYYKHLAGPFDNPTVSQLNPACFQAPAGPIGQLYLRVENRAINAKFDHIYLKDPVTHLYYQGSGADGPANTAHDFNAEGLCDIMELVSHYQVEVRYTVSHPGGYLRAYSLSAKLSDGTGPIAFDSESFQALPTTTPLYPLWNGPGARVSTAGGFSRCAYIFDLVASYRQQDGYHYRTNVHPRRAYYVIP